MWPVWGGSFSPLQRSSSSPRSRSVTSEATGVSGSPGWGGRVLAWLSVPLLGMNSRQPGPAPVIGRVGVSFTTEDLVLVSGASTQAASSQGPTSRPRPPLPQLGLSLRPHGSHVGGSGSGLWGVLTRAASSQGSAPPRNAPARALTVAPREPRGALQPQASEGPG